MRSSNQINPHALLKSLLLLTNRIYISFSTTSSLSVQTVYLAYTPPRRISQITHRLELVFRKRANTHARARPMLIRKGVYSAYKGDREFIRLYARSSDYVEIICRRSVVSHPHCAHISYAKRARNASGVGIYGIGDGGDDLCRFQLD